MSAFFCDTNCELWYTTADELGLKNIIRMPYTIDGQEYYYDLGRETDFKAFYGRVRNGAMPITSALNPQNYYELFEPFFQQGEDILYISFSHQMSNTFEHMQAAYTELKAVYPDRKLTVFDTGSICMGAGYQVYYAAKMHNEGKSDEEIISFLTEFRKHDAVYFMVDSLDHLKRGGRLSGTAAAIGKMFNLKPIITMGLDGKLRTHAKATGRRNAIAQMLKAMKDGRIDTAYPIILLDADDSELVDEFEAKIRASFRKELDIRRQPVGPVIGTHCGPGTVGVVFYQKNKIK